MSKLPAEPVAVLNDRAFRAGFKMMLVCERAGIAYSTWHRMRRGSNPLTSTLADLNKALDRLIHERDGAPPRALIEEAPHGQAHET